MNVTTRGAEQTRAIGRNLSKYLQKGDVVLLSGPMGAGKTTFISGVVAGLGITDHVSSPTFVFIHEYSSVETSVAHVDLFRLADSSGLEDLGVDEYLDGKFIVMVEWPETVHGHNWRQPVWQISIQSSGDERLFEITPPPGREASL